MVGAGVARGRVRVGGAVSTALRSRWNVSVIAAESLACQSRIRVVDSTMKILQLGIREE